MGLIQVHEVPEDVHRRLKARAALAGKSLSEYLRAELARLAARPTPGELRERLGRLAPVEPEEEPAEVIRRLREDG